jgi:hypothetical protein
MFSTALAIAAAAFAYQSDTTRASREAFTSCLSRFVDGAIRSNKPVGEFETEYPQACPAEQAAFRESIIRRDTAMRSTRATAEDSANLEVEDARYNFNERFQMAQPATPRPAAAQAAAAAPAPAAAPAGQPATQTASQTATPPPAQPAAQPQ